MELGQLRWEYQGFVLLKYETILIRVASVKYLFPQPLDVQFVDVKERPFGLNTNLIIFKRTLIERL